MKAPLYIQESPMKLEPYLFFNGRCEEAIAFYQKALGAEVTMLMRMNEAPDPPPPGAIPEGFESKIMHASLRIGEMNLMVSDGNSDMQPSFKGFCLSLGVNDVAEAQRTFAALLQGGGKVTMPLGKTFWSPAFGMLEDPFGVGWMVMCPPEAQEI
jgi:PhnB protein